MGKPKRRWKDNIQTYPKCSIDRRSKLDLTGSGCGPTTLCCENGDGIRFHKELKVSLTLCKPLIYTAEWRHTSTQSSVRY